MKVLQVIVFCLCLRSMSGAAVPKMCACVLKRTMLINFAEKYISMVWPGVCLTVFYPYSAGSSWIRVVKDGKIMHGRKQSFRIQPCHSAYYQKCPKIITRQEWGARKPKATTHLSTPVKYAVVHHSDTPGCFSKSSCIARVKSIQRYHMDHNKWSDIGYNFLIGGDGNVYEGRGWNTVGAHAKGYNSKSIGICVIGNYQLVPPQLASLTSLKEMLACLQNKNKLKNSYLLRGHRDLGSTTCPGQELYNIIKRWPHY